MRGTAPSRNRSAIATLHEKARDDMLAGPPA